MNVSVLILINEDITVIVPAITEPGWKDTFPLAMQDAALFHAILLRSALHANSATGTFKPSELVLHKIKTIQLVNEKLQNPSERLSDSMIMTVAFLAIIECTSADYTAWDLHMNGLSLIIEMRGGMTTLDKWLQLMVYRFDFLGCLATNSRPHFPLPADLINRHPATEPGTLGPYDGFKVITSSFSLDSEIITILNDLQGLLAVKGAEINSCNSPEDVTYITVSLRHRLLLCSPVEPLVTQSNSLSEACRLGLLLYLKTAIACPISYENLLDKLRTCLTSVKMNTDMRPAIAEMVLWLMFLGGTAVPNGPNRAWFVAQLCNTATTLHIHSWDRAKLVLMKFLLIDKMHERLFLDLWQEVLILKSLTRGG
ncbi:fungal-specific transcription factor domain-containing protein [Xylogone sp. PMI_703]|nr:fungal-specific transcription factor domain-containing protein [Xylogone sp. PMI_703]